MMICRCCKNELSDSAGYSVTDSKCWNCMYGRVGADQMRAEAMIADSFLEYGEAAMDSENVDVQGEFDEWLDGADDADCECDAMCEPENLCPVCEEIAMQESDEADPGEMDGDHDSAMESCGWGTDEDYGYYGDECDF